VWTWMIGRCYKPGVNSYNLYGGRGIAVCEEWKNNSNAFIQWALENGWKPGLVIDRKDNDGDYCPENCRFVTQKENQQNRRDNIHLTVNGETLCVIEWERKLGCKKGTIYYWIYDHDQEYAIDRIKHQLEQKPFELKRFQYLTVGNTRQTTSEWAKEIKVKRDTVKYWIKHYGEQEACQRIQSAILVGKYTPIDKWKAKHLREAHNG